MDLISDLGTDLAFAFFVEKRFAQRIDSTEAVALIGRVKTLLESTPVNNRQARDADHRGNSARSVAGQ